MHGIHLTAELHECGASALLVELGDVLCDLGDYDRATATYARALSASGGQNGEASGCLEDVQADSATWQDHVARLVRGSNEADGRFRGTAAAL
mgnify:CR=1 FL=1